MSINHFTDKIKGIIDIDNTTIMCLLVVILVGISSFGLGRLSTVDNKDMSGNNEIILENNNTNIVKGEIGKSVKVDSSQQIVDGNIQQIQKIQKEKLYVASKNGKLYYGINCSGASRIKEENKVWFASKVDAEKAGYSISTSCKQ